MAAALGWLEDAGVRVRERKRGHPSKLVAFRCPEELIEAAQKVGHDRTEGFTILLDIAADSMEQLGLDAWNEAMALAYRENVTIGEMIGRLARAQVEQQRKGSKR
jgi:hypothetical protein